MKIYLNKYNEDEAIVGYVLSVEDAKGLESLAGVKFEKLIYVRIPYIQDLRPVQLGVTKEGYIYMVNIMKSLNRHIGRLWY